MRLPFITLLLSYCYPARVVRGPAAAICRQHTARLPIARPIRALPQREVPSPSFIHSPFRCMHPQRQQAALPSQSLSSPVSGLAATDAACMYLADWTLGMAVRGTWQTPAGRSTYAIIHLPTVDSCCQLYHPLSMDDLRILRGDEDLTSRRSFLPS